MGKKLVENLATMCANLTVAATALAFFDEKVSWCGASFIAICAFIACIKLSNKRDKMEY